MLGTSRGPLNWTGPALPPPDWVANLSIYEINPRDFFGHRVFHLQARICFDENKIFDIVRDIN